MEETKIICPRCGTALETVVARRRPGVYFCEICGAEFGGRRVSAETGAEKQ